MVKLLGPIRARQVTLVIGTGLTALCVLLVYLILGASTSSVNATTLSPGCNDGTTCFWDQPSYSGAKAFFDGSYCCGYHYFGDVEQWNSAKNRLNGRSVKIFEGTESNHTIKGCLDPGDNRPDPGRFNAFEMQNSACGS